MKSRLLSLVLIMSMLLGNIVSYAADNDEKIVESPEDATSENGYLLSDADANLLMLESLNLIDPLKWQSEAVSQGDFLEAVARLCGYTGAEGAVIDSNKVVPGDDIESVVSFAAMNNIISEGVNFDPYASLEWGKAVDMLCHVLGYDAYAKAVGGYYKVKMWRDFINNHSREELITGVDAGALLERAMNTKVVEIIGIKNTVSVYDEREILAYRGLGLYRVEGLVSATSISTLTGKYAGTSSVIVDGVNYYDRNNLYQCYTGLNVSMWVDDEGYIAFCCALEDENDITVVDVCNIGNFNINGMSYYTEKGKAKDIRFSSPIIIYNGKNLVGNEYELYKNDIFNPDDGVVTYIGRRNTGYPDLIKITSLKSLVVKSVNVDKGEVYDKFDPTLFITIENEKDTHKLFDENNKITTVDVLTPGKVITYEASLDGEYINAYITDSAVDGAVTSLSDDTVIINGTEYTFVKSLQQEVSSIKLSKEYTLYLNKNGRVFKFESLESHIQKAVLMAIGRPESVFDDTIRIKVGYDTAHTDTESYPILTLADNVKIDGIRRKTADDKRNALLSAGTTELVPIQFVVNSKGLVTHIDTPVYNSGYEDDKTLRKVADAESLRFTYISNADYTMNIGAKFLATKKTLYAAPKDSTFDEVSFETPGNNEAGKETVSVYTLGGENSITADFVIYKAGKTINAYDDTILYVITQVVTRYDTDSGEEYLHFQLQNGTSVTEYDVHNDLKATASAYDVGDLIRIVRNSSSKIVQIYPMYDYSEKKYIGGTGSSFGDKAIFRELGGQVKKVVDTAMVINMYGLYDEVHPVRTNALYSVEVVRGRVIIEKVTAKDIKAYEEYYESANDIVFTAASNLPRTMYLIN